MINRDVGESFTQSELASKIPPLDQQGVPPCQICNNSCRFIGAVDFSVSGNDYFEGRRLFPFSGCAVAHVQCVSCGFVCAPVFSRFSIDDFRRFIYNDRYIIADPPFQHERPARDSALCARFFHGFETSARFLDFGGGTGRFAEMMRGRGYAVYDSIDPVYASGAAVGAGAYDVITCFEVVEHVPNQQQLAAQVKALLRPDGAWLFSTRLLPDDFAKQGTAWWYIMPRNGHLSFHSERSLRLLLAAQGFDYYRLADDVHLAAPAASPWVARLAFDKSRLKLLPPELNPQPVMRDLPARW